MRLLKFYTLNIVSMFIEYALLYVLFHYAFKYEKSFSLFLTVVVFATISIMLFVVKRRNPFNSKDVSDEESTKMFKDYQYIIDKAQTMSKKEIKYGVIDSKDLHSPAFAMMNTIFINKSYKVHESYKAGLVGHELGHVLSGFITSLYVLQARYTLIIGSLLSVFAQRAANSKVPLVKYIKYILLIPYYIVNSLNFLVYYPFLKGDEYIANSYAIKLGTGDSLRCYYYDTFKRRKRKLNVFDLAHPHPIEMIERMNQEMGYTKPYAKDVYAVDNVIKFIDNVKSKEDKQQKMFNWYLHVGDKSNSFVQSKLGFMYKEGIGTDVDLRSSNKWFIQSVKNGVLKDYYYLAKNYVAIGKTDLAIRNFKEAAVNGVFRAYYDLGVILEEDEDTLEEAFETYYEGSIHSQKDCFNKLTCKFN